MLSLRLTVISVLSVSLANSVVKADEPIVTLDYGSFQGKTSGSVVEFLGIPFAAPPVGNLRFAAPQPPLNFDGVQQATSYGAACTQSGFGDLPGAPPGATPGDIPDIPGGFPPLPTVQSEDCLFLNVVKPASIAQGVKLPVLFWMYGGAFVIGDSSFNPTGPLVNRSIEINEPLIIVSVNYRVNGFGFLGGEEIVAEKSANAGIRDQLFAQQWVQKNIGMFGGDPTKVTIWGESAGAMSAAIHLTLRDGETNGLFRAAFLESGGPLNFSPTSSAQGSFNNIVSAMNCTSASNKLQCLRAIPYDQIKGIVSANGVGPTVDGDLVVRNPWLSLKQGKYARVPILAGNCEDEGTLFAGGSNVTTDDAFLNYVKTSYFPQISDAQLAALGKAYPAAADGSQSKRVADVVGDVIFQASRRYLLNIASESQATYGYRYMKDPQPVLGVSHGSDLNFFFNAVNSTGNFGSDPTIYFTTRLNPNAPSSSSSPIRAYFWPRWSMQSPGINHPLMTFADGTPPMKLTSDTYRQDGMNIIIDLTLKQIESG